MECQVVRCRAQSRRGEHNLPFPEHCGQRRLCRSGEEARTADLGLSARSRPANRPRSLVAAPCWNLIALRFRAVGVDCTKRASRDDQQWSTDVAFDLTSTSAG